MSWTSEEEDCSEAEVKIVKTWWKNYFYEDRACVWTVAGTVTCVETYNDENGGLESVHTKSSSTLYDNGNKTEETTAHQSGGTEVHRYRDNKIVAHEIITWPFRSQMEELITQFQAYAKQK